MGEKHQARTKGAFRRHPADGVQLVRNGKYEEWALRAGLGEFVHVRKTVRVDQPPYNYAHQPEREILRLPGYDVFHEGGGAHEIVARPPQFHDVIVPQRLLMGEVFLLVCFFALLVAVLEVMSEPVVRGAEESAGIALEVRERGQQSCGINVLAAGPTAAEEVAVGNFLDAVRFLQGGNEVDVASEEFGLALVAGHFFAGA